MNSTTTNKVIKKTLVIILAALALGFDAPYAEERPSVKVYEELAGVHSMDVVHLREMYCGGQPPGEKRSQAEKNEAFIGCMMYILGTVDMLRELQKIDPTHAPHICVPRTASSGSLILAVQEHIEATTPWREQQTDAATAVIAALAAKWPCPRGTR
jgi:Rap1a immunity proteins